MENEVEVRGPPVSKAFDDQGNPTKVISDSLSFSSSPNILLCLIMFTNVIACAC